MKKFTETPEFSEKTSRNFKENKLRIVLEFLGKKPLKIGGFSGYKLTYQKNSGPEFFGKINSITCNRES